LVLSQTREEQSIFSYEKKTRCEPNEVEIKLNEMKKIK